MRSLRRSRSSRRLYVLLATALLASSVGIRTAVAQTTFGTLSNFDVFNDTGQECHGFEIELDGISSSDVTYTFTMQRYGAPTVTDFAGGVYVRYESPYDSVNNALTSCGH